jgi:hypothetical protein
MTSSFRLNVDELLAGEEMKLASERWVETTP